MSYVQLQATRSELVLCPVPHVKEFPLTSRGPTFENEDLFQRNNYENHIFPCI